MTNSTVEREETPLQTILRDQYVSRGYSDWLEDPKGIKDTEKKILDWHEKELATIAATARKEMAGGLYLNLIPKSIMTQEIGEAVSINQIQECIDHLLTQLNGTKE